jgi:hypothetical protein
LVKHGYFNKLFRDTDVTFAQSTPANLLTVESMFPPATLPAPLPIPSTLVIQVSSPQLRRAFKKLKKGKASSFDAWSKELLAPIIAQIDNDNVVASIAAVLQDIVNDRLTDPERRFLRTSYLIPLSYKSKPGKIRPITIGSLWVKLSWLVLLQDAPHDALLRTGQTYAKPGGATSAVHTIQRHLTAGGVVVALDAANAFGTIMRSELFDFVSSQSAANMNTRPLLNLLFANLSQVRWGESAFTITNGTNQGCVSSTWAYAAATYRTHIQFLGQLLQVTDDTYVLGPNPFDTATRVISAFRQIGQVLDGPKMRIISSPSATIPRGFSSVVHVTRPTMVLGAVVHPPCLFPPDELTPFVNQQTSVLTAKLRDLIALPLSMQDKAIVLRSFPPDFVYQAQSHQGAWSDEFFSAVDHLILSAFQTFTAVAIPGPQLSLFNTPVQRGGLGYMPLQPLRQHFFNLAAVRASPLLTTLGFVPDAPQADLPSVRATWMALFQDSLSPIAASNMLPTDVPHPSWLQCRPTTRDNTLSDQEFTTALCVRFSNLAPFPLPCAADHLALPDFTDHVMGSCRSCASFMEYHRHQAVVAALHKTLSRFNIPSQLLDAQHADFPLPGNVKGGPDLLVTSASDVFAVDVTVAKNPCASQTSQSTNNAYCRKIRAYAQFAELTSFETTPFVLSHTAVVHAKSVAFIQRLAPHAVGARFLPTVVTAVQFALLRATHVALSIQRHRVATAAAGFGAST